MNTYCFKKVRQRKFQLKEEYLCGTKHCTLKTKLHHCKNYTTLQLYFVLKSTSSLLIRRYRLLFSYFDPHDWYDLIFKEVHVNEPKDITIKRNLTDPHPFFNEIAEMCEEKHVLYTSNYIGEGTLTWGQETNLSDDPPAFIYKDYFHYLLVGQPMRNNKDAIIYPFRDQNHENMRFDLLIYFFFGSDLKKVDLSLHFRTMYAPSVYHNKFIIIWNSTLHLTDDTPGYFLSLSAYYENCFIQNIARLKNGMLKLYWIPYLKKRLVTNISKNNFYLYNDEKETILSWKEAGRNCVSNNSTLPIITNKEIQTELISFIDYAQLPIIFIGLYEFKVSNVGSKINICPKGNTTKLGKPYT